jgi:phytol kinase
MLLMPEALLGIGGVFFILFTDELLWRLKMLRGEKSRGLVHVLVGSFVAFWPFFMSMRAIQIIALAMLVVIAISRKYHIFQSIHAVKRRTYGEFFFPISIGLAALITRTDLIFMAAILHLSLADGLASLVGTRWGGKTKYNFLGQTKSWLGTGVFYVISLGIISAVTFGHMDLFLHANVWLLALLPVVAALTEGVAVYGTDDLIVPLLVVGVLQYLHIVV